jgi:hypothetical protein
MNVCVVIIVAMAILSRDYEHYGIIFMAMCVYYFTFSRYIWWAFTSCVIIHNWKHYVEVLEDKDATGDLTVRFIFTDFTPQLGTS